MLYFMIAIILVFIILFLLVNHLFDVAISTKKDKRKYLSASHNKLEESEIKLKLIHEGEAWYKNVDKEDVFIQSEDGLKLHGNIIINKNKTNLWVIICHGYFGNIKQIVSGAKTFYDLGYNLLLIDSRACGESEGKYSGMGLKEKNDVIRWANYISDNYNESKIVLFGISMGAATVMMCSSQTIPNVIAIIEDCGYTSVFEEFSYQVKMLFKVPSFPVVKLLSTITKVRAGYWLEDVSPIKHVKKATVPILFIHGNKDAFVPPYMIEKLYNSANCKKEMLIIDGAGHGASYWFDSEKYWKTIKGFIDKNI